MLKKFVLADLSEKHDFIKKIIAHLTKTTKQAIVMVDVSKMTKIHDNYTKAITFTFEEGQTLGFVFRTDGDVIKTKMNNKTIPLLKPMDYDDEKGFIDALDLLALRIKSNQLKFNVKRRSTRVVIPRVAKPSVKKRIEETRMYLKELSQIIDQKKRLKDQKTLELRTMEILREVV